MIEQLGLLPGRRAAAWRLPLRPGPQRSQPHRHEELELMFLRGGSADVVVDDRVLRLGPDDTLWLFPDETHALRRASADLSMWIVVLAPDLVTALCTTPESRPLLGRRTPEGLGVRRLGHAAARWVEARLDEAATIEESARHNVALAHIALATWDSGRPDLRYQDLGPVVAGTLRRLDRDPGAWTLPRLAREEGVSPGHLARLVRRETGRSVLEHRHLRQVEVFRALFDRGWHATATEAAYAAGFGSYAQFHRVFRRYMGVSPAEYRRQLRGPEA